MYRTLDCGWSDDPKVRQLPTAGMLLFVYLIANRLSHVSGIYFLPDAMILDALKIDRRTLDTLWNTLAAVGLAYRDKDRAVVLVPKMFKRQGRGEKNHRAAANQIASLHNSPLISKFLDIYPEVRQFVKSSADTLSGGYPALDGFGIPEQEQEQEQDQEEEKGAPLLFKKEPEEPLPDLPDDLAAIPGMSEAWQERLLERKAQKSKGRQTAHQVAGVFKLLRRVVAARGPEHALFCVQRATANCHQGVVFDDDLKPAKKANGAIHQPEIVPPHTSPTPVRHLQSIAQEHYREKFRAGIISREALDARLVEIRAIDDRDKLYRILDEQKRESAPLQPGLHLAAENSAP